MAAEIVRRVAAANAETSGGYVVLLSDPLRRVSEFSYSPPGRTPADRHHAAQVQDGERVAGAVRLMKDR
jgi:hypothetical protein